MINKKSVLLILGSAYLAIVASICFYKTYKLDTNDNQDLVTILEPESKSDNNLEISKQVPKTQSKKIPSTSYVVRGKKYKTLSSNNAKNFTEIGTASWYGPGFHGKKTANGEIYNQNAMTAAHKTLPLSSKIKVTNLENNKTVYLRVNDRGPYYGNRILDLSKKAARELGILGKGTAKIKLQVIG